MAPEKCVADPSRDCLGLAKAEMLEKQIAEYRQQSRETHSELYTRITALEKSDAKRDEQYSKILDKLNDMQTPPSSEAGTARTSAEWGGGSGGC